MALLKKWSEVGERAWYVDNGKTFQAEGTASAKTLRSEDAIRCESSKEASMTRKGWLREFMRIKWGNVCDACSTGPGTKGFFSKDGTWHRIETPAGPQASTKSSCTCQIWAPLLKCICGRDILFLSKKNIVWLGYSKDYSWCYFHMGAGTFTDGPLMCKPH